MVDPANWVEPVPLHLIWLLSEGDRSALSDGRWESGDEWMTTQFVNCDQPVWG